jgi:hypothetical protein
MKVKVVSKINSKERSEWQAYKTNTLYTKNKNRNKRGKLLKKKLRNLQIKVTNKTKEFTET